MVVRKSKAQVTIEYLLFFAFAMLMILMVMNARNSKVRQGVNDVVDASAQGVANMLAEQIE